MFNKNDLEFICCPSCKGELLLKNNNLSCPVCNKDFKIYDDVPILLPDYETNDIKLSLRKWDEIYKKQKNKILAAQKKEFQSKYLVSILKGLKKYCSDFKNKTYVEIGCGPFFIGQNLAAQGSFVIGIDFSLEALRVAKLYLKELGIKNYLLVCGDITKMPLKKNICDLLYGGGVIEHFKDTESVALEIHRILRKNGVSFNTVPLLNLGSLTYRQVWGNIPNLPILKQTAEFIHIKVLKSKHMNYGYELSFTKASLRKIFINAGFKRRNIEIENFQTTITFDYLKNKLLRRIAYLLVYTLPFFWPVIYVMAKK